MQQIQIINPQTPIRDQDDEKEMRKPRARRIGTGGCPWSLGARPPARYILIPNSWRKHVPETERCTKHTLQWKNNYSRRLSRRITTTRIFYLKNTQSVCLVSPLKRVVSAGFHWGRNQWLWTSYNASTSYEALECTSAGQNVFISNHKLQVIMEKPGA